MSDRVKLTRGPKVLILDLPDGFLIRGFEHVVACNVKSLLLHIFFHLFEGCGIRDACRLQEGYKIFWRIDAVWASVAGANE